MRTWDYYYIPYSEGIKKDREGRDDNGFYFNHHEIYTIIYVCNYNSDDEFIEKTLPYNLGGEK